MANTYTIGPVGSTGTSGSYYQGKVDLVETVNTSANTSTVQWYFRIWATQVGSQSNYHYSNGNSVQVTINGSQVYSGSPAVDLRATSASNPQTLASGTVTVPHNEDGTKSLPVTAVYTAPASATVLKSITVSGSKTLETIVRGTDITSASNTSIGSSTSVVWTPRSASHGFKVKFTCGSWSYTSDAIAPNSTSAYTYSYTIPATVANQITTSTTGTCTVKLTTYSEAACTNDIGSTSTTITLTVPNTSDYKPTASVTVTAVNGYGNYNLTGRTSFSCVLAGTAPYSATYNYTFTVTNASSAVVYTYNGSSGTTVAVGPFNTPGTYTFAISLTDSRGRTATASTTKTMTTYTQPTVTASAVRGTGTTSQTFVVDESEGTVARVTYTVTHSGVSSLHVTITPSSGTAVTSTSATGAVFFTNCSLDNSYTFVVSVYDDIIGSSAAVSTTVVLSSAVFPIDFLPNATGMGIHYVATESGSMQIGWNVVIMNGGTLSIKDTNGNTRVELDLTDGLSFYDANGTLTGNYPVNGISGGGAYNITSTDNGNGTQNLSITDA